MIAKLYSNLEDVDRAVARVTTQHGYREIRQDMDRRMAPPREPYVTRQGYETLTDSEKDDVRNLGQVTLDFSRFNARHRIYFSPEVHVPETLAGDFRKFWRVPRMVPLGRR